MNIDFDFFYGDILSDVDSTSPLLSSESTTDLFLEDVNTQEGLPEHLPADFNPDDFINDTQSDNSLFADTNGCSESQIPGLPNTSPSTNQSWDSPQTSPGSSASSEHFIIPSKVLSDHPELVGVHQGNVPLFTTTTIPNGQGFIVNEQRGAVPTLPLLNFCAVTNLPGHTKVSVPKFSRSADPIKVPNRAVVDERVLRKQQRMIRNRESASLSRKKKRDYMNSLETRITVLEKENLNLKFEVTTLKTQLNTITQTCNCNSRQFLTNNKSIGSQVKKNTAVLLAMIFMVSLNFGKFHSFFMPDVDLPRQKLMESTADSNRSSARKLLWVNESLPIEEDIFGPQENCNESLKHGSLNFINQTENLRLTTELRKLAGFKKDLRLPSLKHDDPMPYYDLRLKKWRYLDSFAEDEDDAPKKKKYSKLFQKIHRKNDTFYILSLNSENILFPAALYNESSRPKMSLMLPTTNFFGNKKIAFMQIDCEVLNTSTIQLKESFNFRNHSKNASSKSNGTSNKDKQKFNSDGFRWKVFSKKGMYYGRGVGQNNKNVGVPDINTIYSLF